MKNSKIAIDVGSGLTKWRTDDQEGGFPSVAGLASTDQNAFQVKGIAEDLVRTDNTDFLVGRSADNLLDEEERSTTLTREWSQSPAYRALLYRAIADAFPGGHEGSLSLCVGLPQAYFAEDKSQLQPKLTGEHCFQVGGEWYRIKIPKERLYIIPQSMGIFFHRLTEDTENTLDDLVGVIDVGTFTTGYSLVNRGQFNPRKSGGLELGIANLTEQMATYLWRHHDVELPHSTVSRGLIDGHIRIRGKKQSLRKAIPELVDPLTDDLVGRLREVWGDAADTASILVAGGGGPYVLKSLQRRWPHATLATEEDAHRVVVNGFFSYLCSKGQV